MDEPLFQRGKDLVATTTAEQKRAYGRRGALIRWGHSVNEGS
jgi:hypothetical protein